MFFALLAMLINLAAPLMWSGPPALAFRAPLPPQAQEPKLNSRAALLIEASTGRVLFEQRGFARMAPASTTKIMTATVALERGNLSDVVTVSRRAAALRGSSMGLRAGDQYTLGELLAGLMLRSGNDASIAVAEHISGSVEAFVDLMNQKAREIGATATNFVNPHGLDNPNHYTTAYDLAVMTRYAMLNPKFTELVATREKVVAPEDRPREWVLRNTNRLLWNYEGAGGVKTGTTGQAGNCLVASASRDNLHLISVVLNSPNRWGDSSRLLDWGFNFFTVLKPTSRGDELFQVTVTGGRTDRVTLMAGEDLLVVVPKDIAALVQLRAEVPEQIPAPVYAGQPAGALFAEFEGTPVGQVPLVAGSTVWARMVPYSLFDWLRPFWRWFLRADPWFR